MTTKKQKKNQKKLTSRTVFDFTLSAGDSTRASKSQSNAHCFSAAHGKDSKSLPASLVLLSWQVQKIVTNPGIWHEAGDKGTIGWAGVLPPVKEKPGSGHQLTLTPYGNARDFGALLATKAIDSGVTEVEVHCHGLTKDEVHGLYVGVQLGAYRYRKVRCIAGTIAAPVFSFDRDIPSEISHLATATNLARHLVNVPANELNPETFSDTAVSLFQGVSSVSVDVLRGERLRKERMGLLLAVGGAQPSGPRLVHIKYRPKGVTKAPIAIVGKGITFDSGGLNIKDSASMRLMKKDMGGAASVLGAAYYLINSNLPIPADFYLALAENSISDQAFRPGDVITARSGLQIEIDNTDAEGRLVLADALDYAITRSGKDKPAQIINLATLTGAMRVSLGTKVAGMFATDEALATDLLTAARQASDPLWRMPLVYDYLSHLKSTVADMANSGPSRFGGAISAALFLQRFVGDTPWAHVDLYAWTEGGSGMEEPGGNGQFVQGLAEYFKHLAQEAN